MSNFQEGLFSCFANVKVCLWGTFVPFGACCIQAAAVSKALNKGIVVPFLLVSCLSCVGGAINRGHIRDEFKIQGSLISDALTWCCCGPCAACQEYREVHQRHHHHHS